ncbi:MAG: AAA family ATPase [Bacteroidaceae bacterium]|nr:AAA family ATPase [Bacteroidaceae bacterium]
MRNEILTSKTLLASICAPIEEPIDNMPASIAEVSSNDDSKLATEPNDVALPEDNDLNVTNDGDYDDDDYDVLDDDYEELDDDSEELDDDSEELDDDSEELDDDSEELDDDSEKKDDDSEKKDDDSEKLDDDSEKLDFSPDINEMNDEFIGKFEFLSPLENPREELNKLVGCAGIKRRIDELIALTKYNQQMEKNFPGCKTHHVSLHSIFLGRPGTGKTTVAKIFGSLLHEAGALSKGHVVVCDRGTFLGSFWGDVERAVRHVVRKSRGGVLMIDEAYLLWSDNPNDPCRLTLQLLMNILADETQRDIAVVLCGYKDRMQKLIATNPGLYSRFPNRFEFEDFTVEELLNITQLRIKEYQYQFTEGAWEKYRQQVEQDFMVHDPQTWGNARYVANLLERIYIQHATRCVKQQLTDKNLFRVLNSDDIAPIEVPHQKRKIGF